MLSIRKITVIGSQMELGTVRKGVDMGPLAIRHAGLISKIRDMGFEVKDEGDILCSVAEDEGNPKMRYEKEINESNDLLFTRSLRPMLISMMTPQLLQEIYMACPFQQLPGVGRIHL